MRKYQLLVLTGIIAALAGYFISDQYRKYQNTQRVATAEKPGVAISQGMRPEFSMPDVEGKSHSISEWDGKVVVLNFWATWCAPCRKEIPVFIRLQSEHQEAGLQIIGIAIDAVDETRHYMREIGINYPVLVDENMGMRLAAEFGNRLMALPYTVIIDRTGRIRHRHMGELSRETLLKLLDDLI